ncbi:MAG TPA: 1,4-dihydroxy-2-naphthoate octaprenyltransferase [Candidatus Bathyarchaeia archaeon]|nr:1,4-dihydroxy-2-naphthoate octaprenyltransferase [Candidatus Bathyarchaeia archaeon]
MPQQGLRKSLKVWFHALRPFTYPASIVPILVGSVAWQLRPLNLFLLLSTLLGSVAIQVGTNLSNEYLDYTQGVDKSDSLGPAGVILEGKLAPLHVLYAAILAFAVGAGFGLYIVTQVGWVILLVGLASILAAWFYTAKPLALGYRGLGELEVFFFMGPIMVTAAYYVQARSLSWNPLLISIPVGLLVTAILHANNLRDIVQDNERERVTWVVLACRWFGMERGREVSCWVFYAMIAGAYAILVGLVALKIAPVPALIVIITIPQAYKLIRFVASGVKGRPLSLVVRGTALLHMFFGCALTLGYLLTPLTH